MLRSRWRRFTRPFAASASLQEALDKWADQTMEAAYTRVDDGTTEEEANIPDDVSEMSARVGSEAEDYEADEAISEVSLEAARPCRLGPLVVARAESLLDDEDEKRREGERATARALSVKWRENTKGYFEGWHRRTLARLHFANERFSLENSLYKRALYGAQFSDLRSDSFRRCRAARKELLRAYAAALLVNEVTLLINDETANK